LYRTYQVWFSLSSVIRSKLVSIGLDTEDVGELYRSLSGRLEHIVRRDVCAPEAVIEDACQVAWGDLVRHRGRVRREAALSWLARTAEREAFRLARRELRELSLDATLEQDGDTALGPTSSTLEELVDHHARLESLAKLPGRQQHLVWLQGLGFSYDEMSARTGDSNRTIERQLLRAKRSLRGFER
jgi:RNA polymerase sigma factor (sigma-70 family)